ncbi:MAG: CYTH domain-containing protein [Bacteroidota bacterium]
MEIERKFLVNAAIWSALDGMEAKEITQAYLSKSKEMTIRVRIKGTSGYLTIKGATEGISREEFEYEIPVLEAKQLIDQFAEKSISKERYEVPFQGHTWEIDVFHGPLEGLVLAEIELSSEEEHFEKPNWLAKEVSDDLRYFNSHLIDTTFEALN